MPQIIALPQIIAPLLLSLAAAVLLAGCGGTEPETSDPASIATTAPAAATTTPSQPYDVHITSCTARQPLGSGEAHVQITNKTERITSYSIKIAFGGPGGTTLVPGAEAIALDVAPGRTATATAITGPGLPEGVRCRLVQVVQIPG